MLGSFLVHRRWRLGNRSRAAECAAAPSRFSSWFALSTLISPKRERGKPRRGTRARVLIGERSLTRSTSEENTVRGPIPGIPSLARSG